MKARSILVFAALLAGCAGQPSTPAPAPTVVAAAATPAQPAAAAAKPAGAAPATAGVPATNAAALATDPTLTPEKIREYKREGYAMSVKNGTTWFCKDEVKVGSHLSRAQTVCLTGEQIEMNRAATQQSFGDAERAVARHPGE
jgi:hypothetical protein